MLAGAAHRVNFLVLKPVSKLDFLHIAPTTLQLLFQGGGEQRERQSKAYVASLESRIADDVFTCLV